MAEQSFARQVLMLLADPYGRRRDAQRQADETERLRACLHQIANRAYWFTAYDDPERVGEFTDQVEQAAVEAAGEAGHG